MQPVCGRQTGAAARNESEGVYTWQGIQARDSPSNNPSIQQSLQIRERSFTMRQSSSTAGAGHPGSQVGKGPGKAALPLAAAALLAVMLAMGVPRVGAE